MSLPLLVLLALPLFHRGQAPVEFRARMETSEGSFVLDVHRDWSPHGADRFYQLIRHHYYDNSRFFRVVPGRWAQFGISGNPAVAQHWRYRTIPDDVLLHPNLRGTVAFSNTAPGTRSTQVYINLGDNSARNDREAAFAPFAEVVEGMDVVDHLYSGYGETSGGGMRAGHQDALFHGGNVYLDAKFPRLSRLMRVTILH